MTYKIHQYILYDQYAQKLLLMNDAYLNKKKKRLRSPSKSNQIKLRRFVRIFRSTDVNKYIHNLCQKELTHIRHGSSLIIRNVNIFNFFSN